MMLVGVGETGVMGEGTAAAPFGVALRRLRRRRGLTQEQLAERAGLSVNAISALERGERRRPYPNTVRALTGALELDEQDAAALVGAAGQVEDSAAAVLPRPGQLPVAIRSFVGRGEHLARMDGLLDAVKPVGPQLAVVHGTAGVGKTALAVAWAHRVRHVFPDGQFYVDLRGFDEQPPTDPAAVLEDFLRAMGLGPEQMPSTLEGRAAMWRSVTGEQRILLVLDNASDETQVRPLLPASAGGMVVVTSRRSMLGLTVRDGAESIGLDVFTPAEAVSLVRAVVGADRADAEPAAVRELAELCARLPLAVRVASERAALQSQDPLRVSIDQLSNEAYRLEVLSSGPDLGIAVRSVLSWSYRGLPQRPAGLFRLLGVHPAQQVSAVAAGALAGMKICEARHRLGELAEAHLVEREDGDTFRLHDLLRAYARELSDDEPAADVRDAVSRLVGLYLHSAAAANDRIHPGRERSPLTAAEAEGPADPPGFDSFEAALAWCEAERAALEPMVRLASEHGLHEAAWKLADNLWPFFYLTKYWDDWSAVCRAGLAAAEACGDDRGRLRMLSGLSAIDRDLHRFDEAIAGFTQVLEIARRAVDRRAQGSALLNIADVHIGAGRHVQALPFAQQALTTVQPLGDVYLEGVARGNVGEAYLGLGRYRDALDAFGTVLVLCRQIEHRHGEAMTLLHLSEAYLGLSRHGAAARHATEAIRLSRGNNDRHTEALATDHLGLVQRAAGRPAAARRCWHSALVIMEELGLPRAGVVRGRLHAA
ncbi:ATP-binding protein [Actinoplanes sp. NPDC051859]|uniref:ATP-binding protein n=1 Tax=Actinoplanes sp. NPDC051859 TaxID=3363909 RepID=UPI0037A1A732